MRKYVWSTGTAAMMAAGLFFAEPFPAQAAEPMPAGVSVDGESLEGLTEAEAEEQVQSRVDEKLAREVALTIGEMSFAASSGDLGIAWKNEDQVRQALKDAEVKGNLIQRYMKKKDLEAEPVDLELEFSADPEKISAFVDAECKDAVREASDASITRENGEFVLTPSVVGTTVDPEATGAAIGEAVSQADGASGTVSAAAVVTEKQPEITTEELSSIKDVLGTFSTSFKTSGASRSTNLQVGAAKINGRVLMPGEVLSGYECMQPFTVANGYRAATAYENGRSVDSIGGGVCQISTTLYNASLLAALEIVQRQNHSMTVGYVKPSMDAAIAGTYKDIKIRNPYDTPIYVEGVTSGKTLTFTIYGKETRPANRTLKFESVTLQVMGAGAPIEQVDNSLAPGARVKVDSGHTGLKSELYKCVYVDGELKERTLLNKDTYNASRPIYRVGPAAPAVTDPGAAVPGADPAAPSGGTSETPAGTTPPAVPETPAAENTPPSEVPQGPGYTPGPGMPGDPAGNSSPGGNEGPGQNAGPGGPGAENGGGAPGPGGEPGPGNPAGPGA